MSEKETVEFLIADGWREYQDQFRKFQRCFFKRFETPTRCACNYDKPGIQICAAVSERGNCEFDLAGELEDGAWIKLHQWSITATASESGPLIQRLLATWEFTSNFHKNACCNALP